MYDFKARPELYMQRTCIYSDYILLASTSCTWLSCSAHISLVWCSLYIAEERGADSYRCRRVLRKVRGKESRHAENSKTRLEETVSISPLAKSKKRNRRSKINWRKFVFAKLNFEGKSEFFIVSEFCFKTDRLNFIAKHKYFIEM